VQSRVCKCKCKSRRDADAEGSRNVAALVSPVVSEVPTTYYSMLLPGGNSVEDSTFN
jgi:hypothetical protein